MGAAEALEDSVRGWWSLAAPSAVRFSISRWRAAHRLLLGELALFCDGAVLGVPGSRPVSAAHFLDRLRFRHGFPLVDGIKLVAEFALGEVAVHFPRAVHLALDADAGRQVFQENTVRRFVDFLAARSRATDKLF